MPAAVNDTRNYGREFHTRWAARYRRSFIGETITAVVVGLMSLGLDGMLVWAFVTIPAEETRVHLLDVIKACAVAIALTALFVSFVFFARSSRRQYIEDRDKARAATDD